MTPLRLQEQLCDEIKKIITDFTFFDLEGNQRKVNVFPQTLPLKEPDEEEEQFYPYCIVALDEGRLSDSFDKNEIRVIFQFGILDDLKMQEHVDLMVIMERVMQRFMENRQLENFWRKGDINWALTGEEYYPFSYGLVEMIFQYSVKIEENKWKELC